MFLLRLMSFFFCEDNFVKGRFLYLFPLQGSRGIYSEYLYGFRDSPPQAKKLCACAISIIHIWRKCLTIQGQQGQGIRELFKSNVNNWAKWLIKFIFRYAGKLEREKEKDFESYIEIYGLDLQVATWAMRVQKLQEMLNEFLVTIGENYENLIPQDTFDAPNPFSEVADLDVSDFSSSSGASGKVDDMDFALFLD